MGNGWAFQMVKKYLVILGCLSLISCKNSERYICLVEPSYLYSESVNPYDISESSMKNRVLLPSRTRLKDMDESYGKD